MSIYTALENEFILLDYSPSHNQLLLRSKKNKLRSYNIDIIFKGVTAILLSSLMKGIEISLSDFNDDTSFLERNYDFEINEDYKLFSLKEQRKNTFFINAICFGIYHNNLDILESSIGRYDMDNLGELILWYSN